ncbi:hypothetical protein RBXJA2T_16637 [Rubrivivax benzoatilyticus JA2 = ATCC BAA-35]|nr:hypothetical protein RBXJA2T_16637 [Rubrivivax benzoatilyticus JA2 = ATCC BAA-35]
MAAETAKEALQLRLAELAASAVPSTHQRQPGATEGERHA